MIYLDYAAATPVDKKVLKAMAPFFNDEFYNPSSAYTKAKEVREKYEEARHSIAKIIGASKDEIILTAGATESINLALDSRRKVRDGNRIITSEIDHKAVIANADTLISVDKKGHVNLEELKKKITDKTEIVSIGYANTEIGVIQSIKKISEIVRGVREDRIKRGVKTPLYFHADASGAAGLLDLNVSRLGVDLMTLNAAKCYGPKQVGCLYIKAGVKLTPVLNGGGQEMGLRSGTENVPGVIGFATALEIAEKKRKSETKRLKILRDDLESFIRFNLISSYKVEPYMIEINGCRKNRLPNILNFSIPGLDGERAVFALDFAGVMVSTGSACAANKGTRSHVLEALGLDDATADGSLRISLGRGTTQEEIDEFKKILVKIIPRELKLS